MTNPDESLNKTTHFGFESVAWADKEKKVNSVFQSVANHYNLMNDLMSFGIHRFWKFFAIELSNVRNGQTVLDVASGTGDLTCILSRKIGKKGQVILVDINAAMLNVGRNRLLNKGLLDNISYVQANAQQLPFLDNSFHCITIGFGLRNVTDQEEALRSMFRVCKPGGKLVILEFSTPNLSSLKTIYDWYSFNILPKIGQLIAHDAHSYQYLVESIRKHPNQEELKTMIETSGFEDCLYHNLSGGIVALHIAYKY